MNTVTAIVPTYNRSSYLREALDSILAQTVLPQEIIVVDDGSTDDTAEILKSFPNTRYIYQKNQGPSSARNTGILEANGTWIAFLDSDDLWLPTKIQRQLEEAQKNPDLLVSYTDELWIRNEKRVNQGKRHAKHDGWIFECCLPLCIISPSSVMIHRTVFEKVGLFDKSLPACEDYDLWLRISLHYPIRFIPEPHIQKRGGHSDQLSRKFFGMDRFRIQALQKILQDPALTSNQRDRVIQEIKSKSAVYAQGCLKRDKFQEYEYYRTLI